MNLSKIPNDKRGDTFYIKNSVIYGLINPAILIKFQTSPQIS